MSEIMREVMAQFYATLEEQLKLGLAEGRDVAVSDFTADYDAGVYGGAKAVILRIQPGSEPPQGRRWTVYHTSRGLPS